MPIIRKVNEASRQYVANPAKLDKTLYSSNKKISLSSNSRQARIGADDSLKGSKNLPAPSRQDPFARILAEQNAFASLSQSKEIQTTVKTKKTDDSSIVSLGPINKGTSPTVSHLLKNHPDFRHDSWNIIYSDINKEKPFHAMRDGTEVSINTKTNEIIWNDSPKRALPMVASVDVSSDNLTNDGQIIIGTIDKENPTVSNLLKKHKIFSNDTWNIILSPINKNKQYSLIRENTLITMNPKTFELSLNNKISSSSSQTELHAAALQDSSDRTRETLQKDKSFSERLADSVKPYIGRPYNEIDCYGLLVRGIRSQGVMYGGKGGLRESMERLAMQQGLPLNAYQNGEGLIETVGTQTYTKSYIKINDFQKQSDAVYNEMAPRLNEGAILSFSTPSRGHTGIISQKNGQWTYINSGLIDNQVDSGRVMRRVGEESLKDEIENWFRLAKGRHESLKVSLGMLDEEKLQSYLKTEERDLLSAAPPFQSFSKRSF